MHGIKSWRQSPKANWVHTVNSCNKVSGKQIQVMTQTVKSKRETRHVTAMLAMIQLIAMMLANKGRSNVKK